MFYKTKKEPLKALDCLGLAYEKTSYDSNQNQCEHGCHGRCVQDLPNLDCV